MEAKLIVTVKQAYLVIYSFILILIYFAKFSVPRTLLLWKRQYFFKHEKQTQNQICLKPYEPGHEKMCLKSYANNKGADQPAHPRSLISAFVVRCLDSVVSLVSVTKISSLMLASVAEQASLSLAW